MFIQTHGLFNVVGYCNALSCRRIQIWAPEQGNQVVVGAKVCVLRTSFHSRDGRFLFGMFNLIFGFDDTSGRGVLYFERRAIVGIYNERK
jgi:hypothetical protein